MSGVDALCESELVAGVESLPIWMLGKAQKYVDELRAKADGNGASHGEY